MEKERQLRPFEILEGISRTAMILENAVLEVGDSENVSESFMVDCEKVLRDLRYMANVVTATHTLNRELSIAEFNEMGIIASFGQKYIEIELPYTVVTKTSMLHVMSKQIRSIQRLSNINMAWRAVMRRVVYELGTLPFDTPLKIADVDVTVLCPTKQERDPDHFWFRPLLDSLVSSRVLEDDFSSNVNLTFHYGLDRENPGVIIQVRPGVRPAHFFVRGAALTRKIGVENVNN